MLSRLSSSYLSRSGGRTNVYLGSPPSTRAAHSKHGIVPILRACGVKIK